MTSDTGCYMFGYLGVVEAASSSLVTQTSILNKMHKKIELNRKISALFLFIPPFSVRLYLSNVPWCIVSA